MFEHLVQDVSSRTGLGTVAANDLLRAVVARLLHNPQGGFAPLLVTLRDGGKADVVTQWLGDDPKAGALSPDEAESILGADWVDATSRSLGVSRDEVRIGAAVALPSVAHELTPGGMVPASDELEHGYAGWAGGHVSVNEAPIAGFPTEPTPVGAPASRVEMDLALPSPEIKAKAFDGVATLLPWAALFIALPILSVITCNMYPYAGFSHEHGAAHSTSHASPSHEAGAPGEVSHGEGASSETDVPARTETSPGEAANIEAGNEPNAHGDAGPEAGNAAAGNTAEQGPANAATGANGAAGNTPGEAPPSGNAPAANTP